MVLRSEQFDDIYFSVEDGLAESRHVFLAGNGLPEAWVGRDFTIFELGFGTGLNFLAMLQAWRAQPGKSLRYISVEKYPLEWPQIEGVMQQWPELKAEVTLMEPVYPQGGPLVAGVTLELHIGDVMAVLPAIAGPVDAIFLDGFAPAKNPDMWGEGVMQGLCRLSRPGTTVATFTVARAVRDGLANVGFQIAKARGYGRKRDMLTAIYGAARD